MKKSTLIHVRKPEEGSMMTTISPSELKEWSEGLPKTGHPPALQFRNSPSRESYIYYVYVVTDEIEPKVRGQKVIRRYMAEFVDAVIPASMGTSVMTRVIISYRTWRGDSPPSVGDYVKVVGGFGEEGGLPGRKKLTAYGEATLISA